MDEIYKLFGVRKHKIIIINLDEIKPKSYFFIKFIKNGKSTVKKIKT